MNAMIAEQEPHAAVRDLRFKCGPAPGLPRTMNILVDTGANLSVTIFEEPRSRTMAFASAKLSACCVYWYHPKDPDGEPILDELLPTLSVGDAMFDITEYDAARLVSHLGLREQLDT